MMKNGNPSRIDFDKEWESYLQEVFYIENQLDRLTKLAESERNDEKRRSYFNSMKEISGHLKDISRKMGQLASEEVTHRADLAALIEVIGVDSEEKIGILKNVFPSKSETFNEIYKETARYRHVNSLLKGGVIASGAIFFSGVTLVPHVEQSEALRVWAGVIILLGISQCIAVLSLFFGNWAHRKSVIDRFRSAPAKWIQKLAIACAGIFITVWAYFAFSLIRISSNLVNIPDDWLILLLG